METSTLLSTPPGIAEIRDASFSYTPPEVVTAIESRIKVREVFLPHGLDLDNQYRLKDSTGRQFFMRSMRIANDAGESLATFGRAEEELATNSLVFRGIVSRAGFATRFSFDLISPQGGDRKIDVFTTTDVTVDYLAYLEQRDLQVADIIRLHVHSKK